MTPGTLRFGEIPRLPEVWQQDPESVWTVWDRNTYYLWGANRTNIETARGDPLNGGGMASVEHGPTRGLGHDHYLGIDTMEESGLNDARFADLQQKLAEGSDVVVPTFHGKYSLGTGIGAGMDGETWRRIQRSIMAAIVGLANRASAVSIPAGTFWPDCRTRVDVAGRPRSICDRDYGPHLDEHSPGAHPIADTASLQTIVTLLAT